MATELEYVIVFVFGGRAGVHTAGAGRFSRRKSSAVQRYSTLTWTLYARDVLCTLIGIRFFPIRPFYVFIFTAARSFALRARGLLSVFVFDLISGFLVSRRSSES